MKAMIKPAKNEGSIDKTNPKSAEKLKHNSSSKEILSSHKSMRIPPTLARYLQFLGMIH
jgi:hypothetical protein